MSGNLYLLVQDYCTASGAQFADALRPWLPRLKAKDWTLNHEQSLKAARFCAGTQ